MSRAAPSDLNQCAFRHSLRNLPLRLSTNALSGINPGNLSGSVPAMVILRLVNCSASVSQDLRIRSSKHPSSKPMT